MSEIKQVTDWIDAAQQEPNVRNIANYLAYTMSELGECLDSIDNVALHSLSGDLEKYSKHIRNGLFDQFIASANNTEFLDGAADTAWCAIGLAHMLGDAQGAFNEVIRSNYSKFEGGVCALDETGKVIKGPSFSKPELAQFLRGAK